MIRRSALGRIILRSSFSRPGKKRQRGVGGNNNGDPFAIIAQGNIDKLGWELTSTHRPFTHPFPFDRARPVFFKILMKHIDKENMKKAFMAYSLSAKCLGCAVRLCVLKWSPTTKNLEKGDAKTPNIALACVMRQTASTLRRQIL